MYFLQPLHFVGFMENADKSTAFSFVDAVKNQYVFSAI